MANTLLTISMITREALRVLENNLTFTKHVSRTLDDRFAVEGAKIGRSIRIRKPPKYLVVDGATFVAQDSVETEVTLTVTQKHVPMQFSAMDLTLDIDDFSERFIKPAVAPLANRIDYDGLQLYKDVPRIVGTPGTVPTDMEIFLDAGAELDEEAVPRDDMRATVLEPRAQAKVVNGLQGLFQDSTEVARQYREGTMGRSGGYKWNMDQNVATHTAGTFTTGSTPVVAGAGQTGATINTSGWVISTAVLKQGDVITFAGVNAVNPQSKDDQGILRQFVVTADTSSDGAGLAAVPISPAITTTGAFQNVTAGPADSAAIVPFGTEDGTSKQNLAFHKDAFAMATVPLILPRGTDMAAQISDPQLGISMSLVRDYDINETNFPTRIDVVYGWVTQYPELACRVAG